MKNLNSLRMEMHVHTRCSSDSILPLWLLHIMCVIHRIDCIAITDHNEVKGAQQFKKRYPKINVIVGEEILTKDGEIIGLFLDKRIPPGLSAIDTIQQIHAQNGLVCVPHPFDSKRHKTVLQTQVLEQCLDQIDCIEWYNGRTVNKEDWNMQKELAVQTGLPYVVGSDAHTFYEIGRNFLVIPRANISTLTFLSLLTNANLHTKNGLSIAHKNTKWVKGLKLLCSGNTKQLQQKMKLSKRRNTF